MSVTGLSYYRATVLNCLNTDLGKTICHFYPDHCKKLMSARCQHKKLGNLPTSKTINDKKCQLTKQQPIKRYDII